MCSCQLDTISITFSIAVNYKSFIQINNYISNVQCASYVSGKLWAIFNFEKMGYGSKHAWVDLTQLQLEVMIMSTIFKDQMNSLEHSNSNEITLLVSDCEVKSTTINRSKKYIQNRTKFANDCITRTNALWNVLLFIIYETHWLKQKSPRRW